MNEVKQEQTIKKIVIIYKEPGKNPDLIKVQNSDEEFKKLEALLRKGKLVRENVRDPELIIMDADSPETIQLVLDDMSYLERRWYVFEPEDKQELLDLLMEISE